MTTQTKFVTSRAPAKEVVKDASMVKQKEMMAAHYDRLTSAPETGDKVATTFVPGNLNELIMCFDLLNNLPEVNAIQNGLRRVSGSLRARSGKNRPFGGRLHLREVRHRHDGERQHRAQRQEVSRIPTCCCCPTPAASPS